MLIKGPLDGKSLIEYETMIILSFSLRGVGGTHKKLTLKIHFSKYNLDVILLHETMCEGEEHKGFTINNSKDWSFNSVDCEENQTAILLIGKI